MSKLERLLNLTAALLATERPLTAEEIRGRVPGYPEVDASFHRAFERDKDDLREMGVPVSLEPVAGTDPPRDGYRIRRDDYYLDDPGLEPDELAALHLAASSVRVDGGDELDGLRKLGGLLGEIPEDVPAITALPTTPQVTEAFRGLAERRRLAFRYRGEDRQVEPLRLDHHDGRWYLTAWDLARDAERNFRLDRVDGSIELGQVSDTVRSRDIPPGQQIRAWEIGEGEPVIARLAVDAEQAAWAVRRVGPEAVSERTPDGGVVLALPVSNREGFRSFALTFLDHAEVLDPPELRQDMIAWLEAQA